MCVVGLRPVKDRDDKEQPAVTKGTVSVAAVLQELRDRPPAYKPEPDLSVAVKADADKVRVDLLPVGPMMAIAEVLTFGANKYADHNWRKGFKWSRLLGAAMRHLFSFLRGEDKDPETGLSHLAHLGCCVMFLLEHEQNKLGEDDRYKS